MRFLVFFVSLFFNAIAVAEGLQGKVVSMDGVTDPETVTHLESLPSGKIRVITVFMGNGKSPKLSSNDCKKIGETGAQRSDGVIGCKEFSVYPNLTEAREHSLPRVVRGRDGSYLFQEMTTWGPVNFRIMKSGLGLERQTVTDVDRAIEFMDNSRGVETLDSEKQSHVED